MRKQVPLPMLLTVIGIIGILVLLSLPMVEEIEREHIRQVDRQRRKANEPTPESLRRFLEESSKVKLAGVGR